MSIGFLCLQTLVAAQSLPTSISDLQAKADAGDPKAQYELGKAYSAGKGVSLDDRVAFGWFKKSAEQGHADAQNALGLMYMSGLGVEENRAESLRYYHLAARQKNPSAMFNLGAAYYNGDRTGGGIDDTSSYAWFLLAKEFGSTSAIEAVARAEKQLPIAQQNLSLLQIADMYFKGDELPQDKGEAERWLRIAANRGDPQAQVRLAATLIGHPTPEYDEAFKLCTEAARTGNPAAEYCLGQLYQKGLGTSKNPAEALKWFEAAATQGHLQATESAALMLANGDAGKQDPGKAFIYLFVLIANGDQSAVPQAVKLKAAMSKKEWKKVEEKLRQSGFDPFKVEAALAKGPA